MAKVHFPKCPDFDGFAMCSLQPIAKVASYEWCRKYLDGLEEVNGTITVSTELFLSIIRQAYLDAYHTKEHMDFERYINNKEYPYEIDVSDAAKLEELGLL